MNKFLSIALGGILIVTACSTGSRLSVEPPPTGSLKGIITTESVGYPAPGAVVYLGNTRFRTTCDSTGTFTFTGIPVGTYSLFVQTDHSIHKQGGITISENTLAEIEIIVDPQTDVEPLTRDNLLARVQDLEAEVRELKQKMKGVHAIQSPEYSLYTSYFVGDPEEREIRTLNPGVLQFNSSILPDGSSKITVTSDKPVRIMNRKLGYEVTVWIDKIVFREQKFGLSMDLDISPQFKELIPESHNEQTKWARNREQAFRGSMRHFLVTLADPKPLKREGFKAILDTRRENQVSIGSVSTQNTEITASEDQMLFSTTDTEHVYRLDTDKPIKVIYEPGSIKGFETNFAGIDLGSQISWLLFNDNPILFTSYGTLLSPEKVLARGYWKITRVGDMLPSDYVPGADDR